MTALETRIKSRSEPAGTAAPDPATAPRPPDARQPARDHTPAITGTAMAAITAAAYFLGAGRALDYDGSITVGLFVKHGSVLDVFRSVYSYNNQPYFSFIEHLVWNAGGHSEAALRVVPIVAGVAVVGLLAAWCAARWGAIAGVIAGTTLAANPMFATLSRSVRGYSIMVLGCTVATLILVDARDRLEPMSTARRIAYVAALGIAIGTQFYAVFVLAAHVAALLFDRRFDSGWRRRIPGAVVVGALPYVGMINALVATSRVRKGPFLGSFPADSAREVLGHNPVAVVIFAAVALFALVMRGWRNPLVAAVATITIALATMWIVVHPLDLYPRFVVWLVPAVALAAAWVVGRYPKLVAVVALAVIAMAVYDATSWTTQPIASREIAHIVEEARAQGVHPCATGSNTEVLAGYTGAVTRLQSGVDAEDCGLVFGIPSTESSLLTQMACHFRTETALGGVTGIVVLTHPDPGRPLPC